MLQMSVICNWSLVYEIILDSSEKLKLKEGDKVFFSEEKGKVIFQNASQVALAGLQKEMAGEARKAGFKSEEDVVNYIKEIRETDLK